MEVQSVNKHIIEVVVFGVAAALLMSGSVIFFFFRYHKRLLAQKIQLQATELQHKEQLIQANIRSQDEERLRISKDLHDDVGSRLSGLRLLVSKMASTMPDNHELQNTVSQYKTGIDAVIDDVRNISHSLSPPGIAIWGLHDTLEGYCEQMSASSGIAIHVENSCPDVLARLEYDTMLAIYRIVQELINNTLKHAAANSIGIRFSTNDRDMLLTYTDDGCGMDTSVASKGMGMYNIESRMKMTGGSYTIESSVGNGFSINIRIPQKHTA